MIPTPLKLRDPGGVVGQIVARKHADLATRRRDGLFAAAKAALAHAPTVRDFAAALRGPGVALIAEVKPRSPSRGDLLAGRDPVALARIYDGRAAAISVLCDGPFFGGDLALLRRIRAVTSLPLLCKDFIIDPDQLVEARAAGADAALLMASLLPPHSLGLMLARAAELGLGALVEVHDSAELDEVLASSASVIGINSRDLRTLDVDLGRIEALAKRVPPHRLRVGESGVSSTADVARLCDQVDALLIGSAVAGATDPGARLTDLGWPQGAAGRWQGAPCG